VLRRGAAVFGFQAVWCNRNEGRTVSRTDTSTKSRRCRAASLAARFLFTAGAVAAADQSLPTETATQSGTLVLDGKVKRAQRWSADALRRLPAERVEVSFQTARGIETSSYTGVLLWTLLGEAGGIDDPAKGAELRHIINITGRDGYLVVISTSEIAPDFGDKAAMIAYERDGEALGEKGLRVVMPGDKHGGRYVRDVVEIEVK
jgi:Oxidoreductase molybdopterin binding domain